MAFKDRVEAGKELALHLEKFKNEKGIVLGLPRGGVVVAKEVANKLGWPLDVFISRKISLPLNPEYAIGAITETDTVKLNEQLISSVGNIETSYIEEEVKRQEDEAQRRKNLFRNGEDLPDISDKTVILVDDGIATGFTVFAAIEALKKLKPQKIIIAVPVAPAEIKQDFLDYVDKFIALETPENFLSVGQFYDEFPQISDKEVADILKTKQ